MREQWRLTAVDSLLRVRSPGDVRAAAGKVLNWSQTQVSVPF